LDGFCARVLASSRLLAAIGIFVCGADDCEEAINLQSGEAAIVITRLAHACKKIDDLLAKPAS
jgi:hypothetical protein